MQYFISGVVGYVICDLYLHYINIKASNICKIMKHICKILIIR